MARAKSEAVFDKELYEKLHEAVVDGNTTKIQSLLQEFTKDEARDVLNRNCAHSSVPLLIVAIRSIHKNLVQLLVDHYDVKVDQTDLKPPETIDNAAIEEWTPVLEGVAVRNPVILDIICKKAENIDIGFPVHQACKRPTQGGTDILNVLLRHGAQINIRDNVGITPLIVACQLRNYYLVSFLLQNGADVNICSLDGNTPLHHLILNTKSPDNMFLQFEIKLKLECAHRKSGEQTILKISKELLEHDMQQNPNEKGLTPLYLACLKGSESVVELLLDNISVTDKVRANCFELLASSILLKNSIALTFKFKHNLDKPYHFLNKAMELRHSHNPPLLKCRKHYSLETVLHQLETQTLDELATLKTNFNGLITDLLLARQRILEVELYHDYLLPFMGEYMDYKINEQCHACSYHGWRDNHATALMLNIFRLQRQSLVPPSSHILKERIKWLDEVCKDFNRFGIVNICVFGAILDSIEEFYECKNSENAHVANDTYVLLLRFLQSVVTSEEGIYIKALTKRFLRLTKSSMESYFNPYTNVRPYGRHRPPKLVTGENVLHIACRSIKSTSCHREILEISNITREGEGLAELLKTLHACGEDVNARNSDGQTPLHVFFSGHHLTTCSNFLEAIRSLLLAGANPELIDKSQATSLHAALNGYAHFSQFIYDSVYLKECNSMVELLLKSGANPRARDSRGFTPLHVLMDAVWPDGIKGYDPLRVRSISIKSPDQFAQNRQLFHELVRTIRSYGGCAHATTNDGRSVFDLCMDEELIQKMSQDIPVTSVHLTLTGFAAAAIRKHQLQYRDKLPTRLIRIIEMCD